MSILLGSMAQLLFKKGVTGIGGLNSHTFSRLFISMPIISGVALYGLSLILYLLALSKLELSKAYPMVSLGYLLTFMYGVVILHEEMTALKITGLGFIILGVVFISKVN